MHFTSSIVDFTYHGFVCTVYGTRILVLDSQFIIQSQNMSVIDVIDEHFVRTTLAYIKI